MKVLVISPFNTPISNKFAEGEMWIGLHKAGVEIDIMTQADTKFGKRFQEEGIHVIDFFPERKISMKAIKLLRSLILENKYDILHLIEGYAVSNGIEAAKGMSVKVITYIGSTSLYWHDPMAYLTHLSPRVDRIICVSNNVRKHIQKQLFRNKNKAITIYKGYDPEWFSKAKEINLEPYGIPKDAFVVTCIANVRRVKGIPFLIEAFSKLPKNENIHLVLVGEKMDGAETTSLIDKFKLKEEVHTFGIREDVIDFIKSTDVYVQPSIREGLGRAITEAMSLGKPTIITNSGGSTELINDGENGLIVPIKNPDAIAKSILKLRQHKEFRDEIGRNAKRRITEKFHVKHTVSNTILLYQTLTKK